MSPPSSKLSALTVSETSSAARMTLLKQGLFERTRLPTQSIKRSPVLIFSPGGGMVREFYAAQLEELASHGYVVLS